MNSTNQGNQDMGSRSRKHDSVESYLLFLLQKLTSLNMIPNITGNRISAKTIKNGVKFVQALTKLNPDIINIDISTGTYDSQVSIPDPRNLGIIIQTRHANSNLPHDALQIFIGENILAIQGIFIGNTVVINNITANPSGLKLLIQMEKMQITYLTDRTY